MIGAQMGAELLSAHARGVESLIETWLPAAADTDMRSRFVIDVHDACDDIREDTGTVKRTVVRFDGDAIGEVLTLRDGMTFRTRVLLTGVPVMTDVSAEALS